MRRTLTLLPIVTLLTVCTILPSPLPAQSTLYGLEAGVGAYLQSAPRSAGQVSLEIGNLTSRVASYNTFEARPLTSSAASISARSGVRYVVASSGRMELSGLVQGGVANRAEETSAVFAGGVKAAYYPGWREAPGFYLAGVLEAIGDTNAAIGWYPVAALRIGYQFQDIAGPLATRRKELAARQAALESLNKRMLEVMKKENKAEAVSTPPPAKKQATKKK